MKLYRSRMNTATHRSFSERPSKHSSLNATCSGPSSIRSIMPMAEIADAAQPRLAKGVRLHSDSATGKSALLFPEGLVELNENAQDILIRCDAGTDTEIAQAMARDSGPHHTAIDI